MKNTEPRYETKVVKAIKGTRASTIKKWESQGWELIGEEAGKIQTTLTFRKPKKPISPLMIVGLIVMVLLVAGMGIVGAMFEDKGAKTEASPSASVSTTDSSIAAPPSTSPSIMSQEASEQPVITVKNNDDFAELVQTKGECSPEFYHFVKKYQGRVIEFDGYIANVTDLQYHSDVLVTAGDYDLNTVRGPNFKFQMVDIPEAMNFPKGESPGVFDFGDEMHFKSEITGYRDDPCTIYLSPISTQVR
ncbi:DUF4839 domain-containing protein [Rothia sp. LK2588]|uniref:DUF4839 domain-containing protein n=1 Tax=Rothia sp. LK2588 TaxID=3114369 RepID=UPI0034CE5C21